MKNLTLIIPTKNEKESLPKVIDEIKNLDCKKKVILAPDDIDTVNAIKNLNIDIIYQDHRGYGDALITGINNVDTDYFCIFNADGSFNPSELTGMLELLKNSNLDFVFGSRYQNNSGSDDDTIVTFIGNKIFTLMGKVLFKLPITDILYTFVVGKANKAKKLNMKMESTSSYERKRISGIKKVNAFKDGLSILIHMIKLLFWNKK